MDAKQRLKRMLIFFGSIGKISGLVVGAGTVKSRMAVLWMTLTKSIFCCARRII